MSSYHPRRITASGMHTYHARGSSQRAVGRAISEHTLSKMIGRNLARPLLVGNEHPDKETTLLLFEPAQVRMISMRSRRPRQRTPLDLKNKTHGSGIRSSWGLSRGKT